MFPKSLPSNNAFDAITGKSDLTAVKDRTICFPSTVNTLGAVTEVRVSLCEIIKQFLVLESLGCKMAAFMARGKRDGEVQPQHLFIFYFLS
jgi:hypothetical protein